MNTPAPAPSHDPTVPRGALIATGALVAFAFLSVAAVRTGLVPPSADPVAERSQAHVTPAKSRDLVFIDAADGAVAVRDAATGKLTTAVAAGSKTGFIRGVMRGLARDRHLRGLDKSAPFRLTRWSDGELSLTDTATGRTIELGAFGETNRAAFEALL
ncbi:photosynthetic complex assembly protein PuhC [Glacieibacterium sp.]|uniref:photosynthetic complex assembly protein PuhC n=1 Tax=Glacieibacterium sp. TaxID=2860237 RepID=UPI003B006564